MVSNDNSELVISSMAEVELVASSALHATWRIRLPKRRQSTRLVLIASRIRFLPQDEKVCRKWRSTPCREALIIITSCRIIDCPKNDDMCVDLLRYVISSLPTSLRTSLHINYSDPNIKKYILPIGLILGYALYFS